MKVQAEIFRYGVSPKESALACVAPDSLHRRDPAIAIGCKSRWKQGARHRLRDKNLLDKNTAVFDKNNLSSELSKDKLPKHKDQFETINIVQMNISGLSTKRK